MATIVLAPGAFSDLERLRDFLIAEDPPAASETIGLFLDGLAVVEQHPLIGRPVEAGLRELVISRGRSGYLALYRFDEVRDRVLILSVRHQREAGYV